jgi:hypothetical protein
MTHLKFEPILQLNFTDKKPGITAVKQAQAIDNIVRNTKNCEFVGQGNNINKIRIIRIRTIPENNKLNCFLFIFFTQLAFPWFATEAADFLILKPSSIFHLH